MSNAAATDNRNGTNEFTGPQWGALVCVWLIYGTCYFCRVNIGSANPLITEELLDPKRMGLVLASFKIAYAVGQLVNGHLAERFGARRVLWMGLLGAAAANLAFGFGGGFGSLLTAWTLNGFFQAALWPSCVKIMANWFSPLQRGRAMGVVGTSYQLGSAAAYAVMGFVIVGFGNNWRAAFFLPAGVFLLTAVPAALQLRERPVAPNPVSPNPTTDSSFSGLHALSLAEILRETLSNPRVWVLGIGLAGLNIARFGYLEWAPKHLREVQGVQISGASLQTAVLPLGGVIGVLAAGWLSDRVFQSRRAPVMAMMLAALGVMTLFYEWSVNHLGWQGTAACLSVIGFFIYGPQVMLVGTAPADLARRETAAAAAGFVDALAYAGAATGSWFTGVLVKDHGWDAAVSFWAGAAFAAAVLVATLWHARAGA